ncbi:Poly(3-hydroxybutyrate) depolymerase [Pseudomonas fluorescens]|uniref:Poly(3-hydroxybutyrate) depolymerase n=1 Tax=Pseudomonas fluorescens TaxID=294 RepID=A0A448DT49_PSEFL|nr:alpha/beta hydrolase-fold protein [Pseudomonas fluorescens]VEF10004.1 Poly(3-hydroxybutyrate) depolymerase [Pseudomonas fluorescens]
MKTLFTITLAAAMTLCISVLHATETPDADEIAFNALRPVVSALINADDAQELMDRAEKLESSDTLQAIAVYLAATREDPKQLQAPYQVAALFARRGDDELAERFLRVADDRGLWFGPLMASDKNFADLRESATYKSVLANAQERYKTIAAGKVGAISVLNPSASIPAPKACRPVVVWLHGYGVNGELDGDYQPLADTGAIILGINGNEMINAVDSFRWTGPGFEGTHQTVQKGLESLEAQQCIDRKRVFLMGFSQGSQHAGALLAQHPDDYAGALLLSPGGMQTTPTESKARGKRVFVVNGKKEGPRNQQMSADFRQLFSGGNEVKSRTHEAGHTFPDDWSTSLPQALRWLMGEEA